MRPGWAGPARADNRGGNRSGPSTTLGAAPAGSCGLDFRSRRFDAITCTPTCRQRLRRGQAFAYLEGLSKREQKAERNRHEALDKLIAEHRDRMKVVRARRAENRAKKQARREQALMAYRVESSGP